MTRRGIIARWYHADRRSAEKLMAAQRAGVKKVYIPKDNMPDLEDVAAEVKEKLTIVPVKKITDVLKAEKVMA